MSPRPVSLVVWRDARTDPPTGDMSRQVLVAHHDPAPDRFWVPTMHAVAVARDRGRNIRFWAERPVVSDLTDDDVRNISMWALDGEVLATGSHNAADRLHAALGVRNNVAARLRAALAIRLRAALGGEKEET